MNNKLNKYRSIFLITGVAILFACHNKKSSIALNDTGSVDDAEKVTAHEKLENAKQKTTLNEFVKWCAQETNHLSKTKEIAEMKYHLMYMPCESMAFLELRNEDYDYEKFKTTCTYYSEMTYFNLKLELTNGQGEILKYKLQSPQQYDQRIKYISFGMQNDVYIVQDGDTLRPGLYQFERIFEVAPIATVMMGFDNKKFNREKEFTIVYDDKLFEKGSIKFHYQSKQLIDVPNITGL